MGLPSAVFFAEAGFTVTGVDLKPETVRAIGQGQSPLPDLGLDRRIGKVVKAGRLRAVHDAAAATRDSDAILVMVPTPMGPHGEPDLSFVASAGRAIASGLRKGHLVILESTVYPGVTEEVLRPELEKSGLVAGRDFGLAYCPERYNPGDSEHTIERTQRIVGGLDAASARDAARLYGAITRAGVVTVADIRTAEAAKVIENTQRDVNIALVNEIALALALDRLGLDAQDVFAAAATKWNFLPFRPGPGVGGHCLPKDPLYFASVARRSGFDARLIPTARSINDGMPGHVASLVTSGLATQGTAAKGARVALLGLSYKERIGDTRHSPSLGVAKDLQAAGVRVVTVDPYVPEAEARKMFGSEQHVAEPKDLPAGVDGFVLMVAHPQYSPLDLAQLRRKAGPRPVLVDGRRVVAPADAERHGFLYLGVGAGRHNRKVRDA